MHILKYFLLKKLIQLVCQVKLSLKTHRKPEISVAWLKSDPQAVGFQPLTNFRILNK